MDANKDESKEIYSKHFVPDPVAENAANEAIAATNTESRHPFINRLTIVVAVLIVLAGTFGAIIGAINTLGLTKANSELKAEQKCTSQLVIDLEKEQTIRSKIAADDRDAVDHLVTSIARAKTPEDFTLALQRYHHQRVINNRKRRQLKLPQGPNACVATTSTHAGPTPGALPSGPVPPSLSATSTAISPSATPSSVSGPHLPRVTISAPGRTHTVVVTPKPSQSPHKPSTPKPSHTASHPKPSPSPRPTPSPSSTSIIKKIHKVLCELDVCVPLPTLPGGLSK